MTVKDFIETCGLKSIDARILLLHIVSLQEAEIIAHPERKLTEKQETELLNLVKQRKEGIPVEYLVRQKCFYKDCFYVQQGVLIPQPDTEILVEEAVKLAEKADKEHFRVLDLCSGTGCIGISVAKEIAYMFKDFEIIFADISPVAVKCTNINAENLLHGIKYKIVQGDLFENLSEYKFDMILTNPPYIATDIIPTLESDVRHEPVLALDGGPQGLDLIDRIIREVRQHLNTGSVILMEIGYDQADAVKALFDNNSFKNICVIKDLGDRDRVVKARF